MMLSVDEDIMVRILRPGVTSSMAGIMKRIIC